MFMLRLKYAMAAVLLMIFVTRPARPFFVTDILAWSKMALEYSKHYRALKDIIKTSKKLKEDFEEFKGRFSKIHSGLKKEALEALLDFRDIEFYYNNPYVRISKDDRWKEIWQNTKNLFRKFPHLKDHTALTGTALYKKNREFRERADYRIRGVEQIYRGYEGILKMIADTRGIIDDGAETHGKVEQMIKKYTTQRSTGKLIALLCRLKLDQLEKMDMLITSVRMKMELELKERIIRMDMAKKREMEQVEDRRRARRMLREKN